MAAENIELAGGAVPKRPLPPPPEGSKRAGWLALVFNTVLDNNSPTFSLPGSDRFGRWFSGTAVSGPVGSRAESMAQALQFAVGFRSVSAYRDTVLVVTDQRLLWCVTPAMKLASFADIAGPLELAFEVPRSEVADARVVRYRLNWKRLRIDFTDGSWAAFTKGIAQPPDAARRLAAALG